MCNRYKTERIAEIKKMAFDVYGVDVDTVDWTVRYNIAPNQIVPIIAADEAGKAVATQARWNLMPVYETAESKPYLRTNARAETVLTKPSFRHAIQRRRCLVPADGFFEWEHIDGGKIKIPWLFQMPEGKPFVFAGIWEPATVERPPTFSILTTRPNDMLARFHDRMPAMLLNEAMGRRWLTPGEMTKETLAPFVEPHPPSRMETFEINRAVGSPRNDTVEAIAKVKRIESVTPAAAKSPEQSNQTQGELF